jgi:hypothetical protein
MDRRTLPKGETFTKLPPKKRQAFDVTLDVTVAEHQAEVLVDSKGRRHTAPFMQFRNAPEGESRGNGSSLRALTYSEGRWAQFWQKIDSRGFQLVA